MGVSSGKKTAADLVVMGFSLYSVNAMAYKTLRDFIEALDNAGELARVSARVSPLLEVSEIACRMARSAAVSVSETAKITDPHHYDLGGKALLFEDVEGSDVPLVMNVFGSYRRMEMALGCVDGGFESLAERIEGLMSMRPVAGMVEKVKRGLELAKVASFVPGVVRSGICQEVVVEGDDIDLFSLPVIKCWPLDGDPSAFGYPYGLQSPGEGRYITFGQMFTIHPDDAGKADSWARESRNVGMYRAQVLTKNSTAMHWHVHHDGAGHWRRWKKCGAKEGMPLAIVFGGESVLPYAASAPLPMGMSELLFAGFLNGKGIDLVKCRTIDMHVPANAEIVIEGYVSTEAGDAGFDPRVSVVDGLGDGGHFEGPFGDHTGFYSLPDRYPVFRVTAITHRRDPIYPATVVGMPPQEDYYLGKATERIFLPLLKMFVPDIVDYHLPMFGVFHNCAFVKIRKEYPLQARRVMHALWGMGQMSWTKMIIVVDETVNVHDEQEVMLHLCANVDPVRDVEVVSGPVDVLDHASPGLGTGHKMGFDATAKIKSESVKGVLVRDWPSVAKMPDEIKERVTRRWSELGLD